jgi:hypothetical protein
MIWRTEIYLASVGILTPGHCTDYTVPAPITPHTTSTYIKKVWFGMCLEKGAAVTSIYFGDHH